MSKPNRLINEKSPYLLQHAYNPVDWYAWGPEAFEKARKEDKPILLSIGYSTCHWCHVMERESFENPAIAEVMNQNLVCIKLDREERPDIDKIYMTAVSAMTGSGGWPLNAFLSPDLKPFYGGTYFPPEDRWGRMGWPQVVERIGAAWKVPENRQKLLESAENVSKGVAQFLSAPADPAEAGTETLDAAWASYRGSFDAAQGGFSPAPKFPMPVNQNFLFRYYARTKDAETRSVTLDTLKAMARGGIYDHLGGGFSRYSTDERWHVPHFEKMLYDNAQLAVNFIEAYQISQDEGFARVARETLDYVRRDMTHPDGAFYSAEDADSLSSLDAEHKTEGAFYVWEKPEVLKLLGPEAGEVFCARYGVESSGNAQHDPHGEFTNKNILYIAGEMGDLAKRFGKPEAELEKTLESARRRLFDVRAHRPRPHLDDKVLTSWNALMISAFAKAAQVFEDPACEKAAVAAARFLRTKLFDEKSRRLYRRWRDGERRVPGTADDYAFLAQALVDLYETDFDPAWLDWAVELAETLLKDFYDAERGGFYMTAPGHDDSLIMRVKESSDNVEPCADSVAALTLLRLAEFTGRQDFRAAADKTLKAFGLVMNEQPRGVPQMLCALDWALGKPIQAVIAAPSAEAAKDMLRALRKRFLPHKIVILLDGGERGKAMAARLPFLKELFPSDKKPKAFVCVDRACRLPAADPLALDEQLKAL